MRAFLKWLRRAVLAVVVLVAAGAASGYLWLRGSLPQIDGERAAYGLDAPVEVVRDRNGVPHILARSEEDALFALGFVHAQDRLWQMEMNRRIGAGRLAEVLGAPALGTDRLLRVLGLYRRATAALAHLAPDARRRIDAYVNGVNAWLETRTGPLPPEFLILGFEPEPWTAADTAVWAKVMALDLGREWARDLMRLRMADFLAPERILDFYTPYREDKPRGVLLPGPDPSSRAAPAGEDGAPGAGYEPLPDPGRAPPRAERAAPSDRGPDREGSHPGRGRTLRREAPPDPAPGTGLAHVRAPLPAANVHPGADADPPGGAHPSPRPGGFTLRPRSGHPGSNSWAVSGARSASGRPLLANDPHLGLSVPSVWYLAHLSWPGRDVVGATFPGMPVVVLGHNGRAAWGLTNTGADTQDLYLEKLDPSNPARYLTPDGYRRFEVHHEEIEVKDGDEVVLRVRETRHGPVLDDASAAAAGASPPGHVLALGWTALRDDDRTLEAGLGLPEADDWPSFVANFERFHSPPQNVAYADVDGDIGFLVAGRIPVRPRVGPDRVRPGTVPRPGWHADHDWPGFIRFDALPRVHNPPGGAVVAANHAVTARDYPYPLTFEWAAGYRAERIMDQLASRIRHDVYSFRSLQQDRVSHFARALLPRLRRVPLGPQVEPLARRARALLDGWDGDMDPGRPEPLVFNAWIWEFGRLASADELGALQRAAWGRKGAFIQRVLESREIWCDDVGTERPETCDDVLARALERAVRRVAKRQGDDPAAWRWGEEHIALAEHRPLASSPLAFLFNLRGPAPGSVYSVNSFEFSPLDSERPFASTHGPSLRAIYDLADLDGSLFIHSTGQSGNVLSPLYDSFEERWRNGEYVTIPTRRGAFADGALGRLRLVPR
ncbi:MAG: penicillin acylase family protein [Immundisolibacterales bacterium]|nr:penicillin acylase family protein [Immundisolibacterales bacterium]